MLHPSSFGVKVLPPGRSPGKRIPLSGGWWWWEGGGGERDEAGEAGGGDRELGDFSILPDFRTCPSSLTLSTPPGGNHTLSLTKPPPSLLGVAAALSVEGHRPAQGKEVKIPAALTLCPSASGRVRSTPFFPPGTLQGTSIPFPWPSSPLLHSLQLIQPFYRHFHISERLPPPPPQPLPPKKKTTKQKTKLLGEGEKEENCSFRGAEQLWLWRSTANQLLLLPSQYCSIAGQRHL